MNKITIIDIDISQNHSKYYKIPREEINVNIYLFTYICLDEEEFPDESIAKYGKRLRDQHDLWHVVTGYGRDELGELCLLGFTYAQTKNRGVGLIVLVGFYQFLRNVGSFTLRPIRRGYEDGRKASWLPAEHWETLLSHPLEEVRQKLKIIFIFINFSKQY